MQLLTLGGLRLGTTEFTRPKPLLLLCYLAVEGSQSRRVLAELFFADTKDPRDSLSTAFRQLRAVDDQIIVAQDDRLASALPSDVRRLIEALDAGLLEPAIDLYEGSFLDGLDLELGQELEEWVFTTREYLSRRVREAHLRVGESFMLEHDSAAVASHAEAAFDLGGPHDLAPDDFPRLFRLLRFGKSRRAADLGNLADELGIELETKEDAISADLAQRITPSLRHNLPPPTTSFVGRDAERLEIAELLASSHARIITIHGPGGIGKSRLALRAARDQLQDGAFGDGIHLVELEPLSDAAQIAESLLAVLDEPVGSGIDGLRETIGEKRILLLLDGFEHLVDGATLLSTLVSACPQLRFLVTSRQRLHLDEEHVLPLHGLYLPASNATPEEILNSDSMQLLIQRAKKARLDFQLQHHDIRGAVQICRKLDGSPLGIELAMSWIRLMPIASIFHELERDLSFLASSARNPKRSHASLRTVFMRSWSLLGNREREVLSSLAVFRGGFRREAATDVANATIPVLVRLVDASLVAVGIDGRYRLHALVEHFCIERLREDRDREREALIRHHEHFRSYVADQLAFMYTGKEPEALEAILVDLPNILAAWDHIFATADDVERSFPSQLVVFFDRVGLMQEGSRFFERARAALEDRGGAEPATLRQVYANLAWLYYRLGRHGDAEGAARTAVADPQAADVAMMVASNTLALVRMDASRIADSVAPFERAVDIASKLGHHNRASMYLLNLARACKLLGDFDTATRHNEEAIRIAKEHRYPYAQALALNNLGALQEAVGSLHGAVDSYVEALDIIERNGYHRLVPRALANLAECHWAMGNPSRSARYLEELQAHRPDDQDGIVESLSLHLQGRQELHRGDIERAKASLERALDIARGHLHDQRHIKILPDLARAWIAQGNWSEAHGILQTVLQEATPGTELHRSATSLMETVRSNADGVAFVLGQDGRSPATSGAGMGEDGQ